MTHRSTTTASATAAPTLERSTISVRRSDGEHARRRSTSRRSVSAWFGKRKVLERCSLTMAAHQVTALIGPSGCGKSTFLRILNRMHEVIPGAQIAGQVELDGVDIYGAALSATAGADADRHGVPEAEPVPGDDDRRQRARRPEALAHDASRDKEALVEECLTRAGLWNEVKDRLNEGGMSLSGGQQQRLCIARVARGAPAGAPDGRAVLGARPDLDPRRRGDDRASSRHDITIVIVTHNMQQAARVSDQCAFFLVEEFGEPGRIVEVRRHEEDVRVARRPAHPRLRDRAVRMSRVASRVRASCALVVAVLVVVAGPSPAAPAGRRLADHRRRLGLRRARDRPVAGRHRPRAVQPQRSTTSRRARRSAASSSSSGTSTSARPTSRTSRPSCPTLQGSARCGGRAPQRLLRLRAGQRRRARVHVQPRRRRRSPSQRISS